MASDDDELREGLRGWGTDVPLEPDEIERRRADLRWLAWDGDDS